MKDPSAMSREKEEPPKVSHLSHAEPLLESLIHQLSVCQNGGNNLVAVDPSAQSLTLCGFIEETNTLISQKVKL